MTRIGLFHDNGTGDRSSIFLLSTYNYAGDLKTLDGVISTVLFDLAYLPEMPNDPCASDNFYALTTDEFFDAQKAEEQDIFPWDTDERMEDDSMAKDLPTDTFGAAAVILGRVIDEMNLITDQVTVHTLDTGEKVRDAIETHESAVKAKEKAEHDARAENATKNGIAVGDSVYRIGVWDHQLSEGKVRAYADERSNKLLTYTGEDDADEYIKADQIDIKAAKKALDIFPLPSDYKSSKWYGRFKNNRKIEITGNKQAEIILRAAVIMAAQERLNARNGS